MIRFTRMGIFLVFIAASTTAFAGPTEEPPELDPDINSIPDGEFVPTMYEIATGAIHWIRPQKGFRRGVHKRVLDAIHHRVLTPLEAQNIAESRLFLACGFVKVKGTIAVSGYNSYASATFNKPKNEGITQDQFAMNRMIKPRYQEIILTKVAEAWSLPFDANPNAYEGGATTVVNADGLMPEWRDVIKRVNQRFFGFEKPRFSWCLNALEWWRRRGRLLPAIH